MIFNFTWSVIYMYKNTRRIFCALAATAIAFSSTVSVSASNLTGADIDICNTPSIERFIDNYEYEYFLDDLNTQLNDLYHTVGEYVGLDYKYVKMLHLIAGGKAVYAEKMPNINVDETVEYLSGPFDLPGVDIPYEVEAPFVRCKDSSIIRPSKCFLPDAAYNTTLFIKTKMDERMQYDRGANQEYFNSLSDDSKTFVTFVEALLEVTGSSYMNVDNVYNIYQLISMAREAGENIVVCDENGVYSLKQKFSDILMLNGYTSDNELNVFSVAYRFNDLLVLGDPTESMTSNIVFPYELNTASRMNMMKAAASLVGRVRYVWGGGHLYSGSMDGINPMWINFFNTYSSEAGSASYKRCIKPSISWCPVHGITYETSCLDKSFSIKSADEYIKNMSKYMQISSSSADTLRVLLYNIPMHNGMASHRLDGLDCSGFTSWLYNQMTDDYNFDSGATRFISQAGIDEIDIHSELLPGDVYSWGDHIVVIVGRLDSDNDCYITVEATPNMVKFGAAGYNKTSDAKKILAREIAMEANKLIGNINTEGAAYYNMDACGLSKSDDERMIGYHACGRLGIAFNDEIIEGYGKTINDMTAQEIIQYLADNMPSAYVSGASTYVGKHFRTYNSNALSGIASSFINIA